VRDTAWLLTGLAVAVAACGAAPDTSPHHEADAGVVAVAGTTLPYVIEGAGRDCIVLGSHVYYPRTFSNRFKAALRCAYVDHRAFVGDAPAPADGPFTIETAVDDFDQVRRALGLGRVVVVGHSVQGLMALAYALRFPDHVSHVIAIGAPPVLGDVLGRSSAEFWDADASPERRAADARNQARLTADSLRMLDPSAAFIASYVASAARYWADPTYDAAWLWQGVTVNMDRVAELFDPKRPYELPRNQPPVSVPVLVILGRYDYAVPPMLWDNIESPFQDLTVEVFAGSGHTPQLEEQTAFDRTVLAWLSKR
jgi:proline iminopeptidase